MTTENASAPSGAGTKKLQGHGVKPMVLEVNLICSPQTSGIITANNDATNDQLSTSFSDAQAAR